MRSSELILDKLSDLLAVMTPNLEFQNSMHPLLAALALTSLTSQPSTRPQLMSPIDAQIRALSIHLLRRYRQRVQDPSKLDIAIKSVLDKRLRNKRGTDLILTRFGKMKKAELDKLFGSYSEKTGIAKWKEAEYRNVLSSMSQAKLKYSVWPEKFEERQRARNEKSKNSEGPEEHVALLRQIRPTDEGARTTVPSSAYRPVITLQGLYCKDETLFDESTSSDEPYILSYSMGEDSKTRFRTSTGWKDIERDHLYMKPQVEIFQLVDDENTRLVDNSNGDYSFSPYRPMNMFIFTVLLEADGRFPIVGDGTGSFTSENAIDNQTIFETWCRVAEGIGGYGAFNATTVMYIVQLLNKGNDWYNDDDVLGDRVTLLSESNVKEWMSTDFVAPRWGRHINGSEMLQHFSGEESNYYVGFTITGGGLIPKSE